LSLNKSEFRLKQKVPLAYNSVIAELPFTSFMFWERQRVKVYLPERQAA